MSSYWKAVDPDQGVPVCLRQANIVLRCGWLMCLFAVTYVCSVIFTSCVKTLALKVRKESVEHKKNMHLPRPFRAEKQRNMS